MSVLDSSIQEFDIQWEIIGYNGSPEKGTEGKIHNQNELVLGKFLSKKNREYGYEILVLDNDENLILKIKQESSWKMKIRITDSQQNEIGIAKILKGSNHPVSLVNSNDEEILIANIDDKKKIGKIQDLPTKTLAEFSVIQDKIKRGFLRESSYKTKCNLKILDAEYDKQVLLGFFFAIIHIIIPAPTTIGV